MEIKESKTNPWTRRTPIMTKWRYKFLFKYCYYYTFIFIYSTKVFYKFCILNLGHFLSWIVKRLIIFILFRFHRSMKTFQYVHYDYKISNWSEVFIFIYMNQKSKHSYNYSFQIRKCWWSIYVNYLSPLCVIRIE